MIAKITQEHINEGKLQDCQHCPAALALNEMSKTSWSVGETTLNHSGSNLIGWSFEVLRTPPELASWIRNFDFSGGARSALPKPFEFHISAEAFMR